ncbi:MAG: DHHW family protein [Oscillospiraceae bacterium]|nr:DHHW family protein [Oscillospiraceae bacterium]
MLLVIITAALNAAGCSSGGDGEIAGVNGELTPDFTDNSDNFLPEREKTKTPVLTDRTFLSSERYCIAGKGEENSVIKITGGLYPAEAKITGGQFIAEIFLEDQTSRDIEIKIYAKSDGKDESEPLTFVISRRESREGKPLYIGSDNQIHYNETIDDFLGRGLFNEGELELIKNGAENLRRRLIDEGLNTKLIIFIAPNPGTIYPETMPVFLRERIESENSRLKQLDELFKSSDSDSGLKFINPYDRLIREKENYFLYNRTDTHWNELGAYFGYCEIFDYIGEFFPEAKPMPLEDFNIYRSVVRGGDLIPMLKFDQDEVTENAYAVRVKEPKIRGLHRHDTDEIPYQEQQYHGFLEYNNNDASKPSIIMYRDSFSISMLSPVAETSNRIIFCNMWDYEINIDYIKEINPDFIIIQRVERLIYDLPATFRRFR